MASTGARFTVTVSRNGRFRLSVPSGRYQLTGYSPRVRSGGAEMRCFARNSVRAKVGELIHGVHVVCPIM
jgi:hypothetical protein